MKGQLRIDEMYAFVVVDEDGTEGIPAFTAGDLAMPMVGADMAKIEDLRPIAAHVASSFGKRVELVKFSSREHLEWIEAPG